MATIHAETRLLTGPVVDDTDDAIIDHKVRLVNTDQFSLIGNRNAFLSVNL